MALKLRIRRKAEKRLDLSKYMVEIDFGEKPPYLEEYIREVKEKLGEPMFVDRLSGEMKKWKEFNIIYPVGAGVFIHVHTPIGEIGGYKKYNVIEPPKPHPQLMRVIEEVLAERISSEFIPRSSEEKRAYLLYLLDQILVPTEKVDYENIKVKRGKVPVRKEDVNYIKYHLVREKVGVGLLEPLLRDPYLEDISCSGLGNIFVVHKLFENMETNIGFESEEELDSFIIKLGEKIGKPISTARPVVDATLPDGSRINIVFGKDVSLRGSNFTIRRVAKTPISVTQLISWGTFDARIAAYIWMLLREGMSVFVCGETASGKTTTLNAISVFIRPTAKIVTIEDTAEVVLPHPNWTRELTRDTGRPESSVTMFDLLKAALRQRPNYIIVGEIRGAEGNIAFQAMQSVAFDTPVLVRIGGEPILMNIGDLVDAYYSDGEGGRPKKVERIEVLSLNKNGKLVWSPVRYVLRHRANSVYRIRCSNGSIVRATGSHSVFVLDIKNMTIRPAFVSKLKRGDILVSPRSNTSCLGQSVLGTLGRFIRKGFTQLHSITAMGVSSRVKRYWEHRLRGNGSRSIPTVLAQCIVGEGKSVPSSLRYLKHRVVNGKSKHLKARTLQKLAEAVELNSGVRERIRTLLNSDIELTIVEEVEEENYEGYVYDLSVPETELFFGGNVPIALHNTGHPVMATFHAANLERLIQRLTNPPINVPKTNLDSLNLAWFQSSVYIKGFLARRVIAINELMGYDPQSDAIAAMPVFTWDPVEDRFIFAGRGASYLLEEKIAVMRGLPRSRISEIYEELETRRRYIQLLVEKKVFEYNKVFKAVIYAEEVGIEKALRNLEAGKVSF